MKINDLAGLRHATAPLHSFLGSAKRAATRANPRWRPKLDRVPKGVNLAWLLVFLAITGCVHTGRMVPVPAGLTAWTTPQETARRDAGATETAPVDPVETWRHDLGSGQLFPIAIRDGLLFSTTMDRRVTVVDAAGGERYWQRRLRGAAAGSAVFDGTSVYVTSQETDSYVQSFEIHRGLGLWATELPRPTGAPLLDGDRLFVPTARGELFAIRTVDGGVSWRARFRGGLIGAPIPTGSELLVLGATDSLFRVSTADGAVRDRMVLPATPSATPALGGDRLVVPLADTTVVRVDLATWALVGRATLPDVVRAAPILAPDGATWLLTDRCGLWRWAPEASSPVRIADLGGACRASLALAANGALVGRLDGHLFLVGFDGETVWERDVEDSIDAPALAWRGAVYVPLLRGDLVRLGQRGAR